MLSPSPLLTLQKKYIFWFSRLTSNTTSFFDTNTLNWPLCASTKSYRMFIIVPITLDSSYLPLGLHINPPSPIRHSLYCELLKGGDSIWIYLWIFMPTLVQCSVHFCWMNQSVLLQLITHIYTQLFHNKEKVYIVSTRCFLNPWTNQYIITSHLLHNSQNKPLMNRNL